MSARRPFVALPHAGDSRLTHARLRRPTPLPQLRLSSVAAGYLQRLRWLFGGS